MTAIRDIPTLEGVFLSLEPNISYISDYAFSGLPSLKTLDLRSNRISLYSAQLAVHVSLLLGDNKLTSFDAQSLNLTTLQLLNADDNKHLQNMSLIETPSVRSLYAAYCNLHEIVIISQGGYSEELASQHPLEYMHLNENKFRDLSRFHDLPQLRALKFSDNVISEIGENGLVGLSDLESLYLSNNRFTAIPNFPQMQSLQTLDLSNNEIAIISVSSLEELTHLDELLLGGNRITQVPVFPGTLSLNKLDLHDNPIASNEENPFQHLKSLEELDMQNCNLSTISSIGSSSSLTNLFLSNNSIAELSSESPANFPNIEFLKMDYNALTTIPHFCQ